MKAETEMEWWILWVRISSDRAGDEHGVKDQEHYLREEADRIGAKIKWVIRENDTSASQRTRKVPDPDNPGGFIMRTKRPKLQEIFQLIRSGKAAGLIVRDGDRAFRDGRDLQDFIDVVERSSPRVKVHSLKGTLRFETGNDIMFARMEVARAIREAELISERITDTKRLRARDGKYRGGPRPYGFEKNGVTIRESEAAVIRKAADAVLDGESLSSICRDMNRTGVPVRGAARRNRAGVVSSTDWMGKEKAWGVVGLRQILLRARNAGLVEHWNKDTKEYDIVGTAVWTAIIPEEKWRAVCNILNNPARRISPGPKPQHIGTGVYYCGVCLEDGDGTESFMGGQGDGLRANYHCMRKNHFSIRRKADIDALVISEITRVLAEPDAVRFLRKPEGEKPDTARLSEDAARLRRQLRELEESYKRGEENGGISIARFETVSRDLERQKAEAEAQMQAYSEEDPLAGIAGHPDAAALWAGLPVPRQRAIIRDLVEVVIYRPERQPNQHTPFDPGNVGIAWLR